MCILQVPDVPAGAKFRTLTRRHNGRRTGEDGGSRRRAADELTTLTSGTTSDMDRWLEHVFDQALDGTVDDTDDERTLSGRLKGGGDNPPQGSKVCLPHILFTSIVHYLARCRPRFYRAMHFSAKRGIAIACRLSVRPSVCLSVCL